MRTPKTLCPTERTIYRPELPACPVCSGPLAMYNYLTWDKTVQTPFPLIITNHQSVR